jgi:ubiquitin carboxyl-terminal hydrolase 9/24
MSIKLTVLITLQAPQNYSHVQRNPHVFYRHEVINKLQQTHSLVTLVADNLATYMEKVLILLEGKDRIFSLKTHTQEKLPIIQSVYIVL